MLYEHLLHCIPNVTLDHGLIWIVDVWESTKSFSPIWTFIRSLKILISQWQWQYISFFHYCVFCIKHACINQDFHVIFSSAVEVEKLVEMKRERECRSEEKAGGKGSTEGSELQTNQKLHPPVSPIPTSSPESPVSSPVSALSSTVDQVQATLPSSPPPKQSWYLHYGIVEMYTYFIKMYLWVLNKVKCLIPQIYMPRMN